jgi:hypothetical protein
LIWPSTQRECKQKEKKGDENSGQGANGGRKERYLLNTSAVHLSKQSHDKRLLSCSGGPIEEEVRAISLSHLQRAQTG